MGTIYGKTWDSSHTGVRDTYSSKSGQGEIQEYDELVLNSLFTKITKITDKVSQISGIDYICYSADGKQVNVDIKGDHYTSTNNFIYELADSTMNSWTKNTKTQHKTDWIIYILYCSDNNYLEAYVLDYEWVTKEFPKTQVFSDRVTYWMGQKTRGKFFRVCGPRADIPSEPYYSEKLGRVVKPLIRKIRIKKPDIQPDCKSYRPMSDCNKFMNYSSPCIDNPNDKAEITSMLGPNALTIGASRLLESKVIRP